MACGFSYVAAGSFNRSGVNYAAGAKTPIAAVLAGLFLLIVVLFVAPPGRLPAQRGHGRHPASGGMGAHRLRGDRCHIEEKSQEFVILVATFASTLFLSLEEAIILGVILGPLLVPHLTSPGAGARPRPAQQSPQVHGRDPCTPVPPNAFRADRRIHLFWRHLLCTKGTVRVGLCLQNKKHVAIVAHGINFVDKEGVHFLEEEAEKRRQAGGGLYFIRPKDTVYEPLDEHDILKAIGGKNMFD